MRGGLLRSWSGLAVVSLLSACSTIIGVSDYEIDPTVGEGSGGSSSAGRSSDGGKTPMAGTSSVDAGAPAGGDDTGVGGKAISMGGKSTGGQSTGGSTPMGGDPTPIGCQGAGDCDDTIDCTTDTCNASHVCVHTAKDTLCDASLCESCQVGIGCVAGPKATMQLLLDPNFDLQTGDWDESGSDGTNVSVVVGAQSGTRAAKFGPGDLTADEGEYSDLLQYVTIPEGTIALSLTGYYKLAPGTFAPADDYLVAAFYEDGAIKPFTQFHSFEATAGAQVAWKMFTYNAPKADVLQMGGTEYTFDLVAHLWDTVFHFDSLQLNATVCQ
jgi:hypothetical protein